MFAAGSSPRPWGIRPDPLRRNDGGRFIPTPVGNTRSKGIGSRRVAVHPHARGEYDCVYWPGPAAVGSSPRPWGIPYLRSSVVQFCRFIPTPVGNTFTGATRACRATVHPHARGEYHVRLKAAAPIVGSSLRLWGTPICLECALVISRFIPTPVGNTTVAEIARFQRAVHPHACGEHSTREVPC